MNKASINICAQIIVWKVFVLLGKMPRNAIVGLKIYHFQTTILAVLLIYLYITFFNTWITPIILHLYLTVYAIDNWACVYAWAACVCACVEESFMEEVLGQRDYSFKRKERERNSKICFRELSSSKHLVNGW